MAHEDHTDGHGLAVAPGRASRIGCFILHNFSFFGILGAIGLVIGAQFQLQSGAETAAGALYAAGMLVFLAAGAGRRDQAPCDVLDGRPSDAASTSRRPVPEGRERSELIMIGGLLIALCVAILSWTQFDFATPSHTGWLLYGVALIVLVISLSTPWFASLPAFFRSQRAYLHLPPAYGGLLVILALAAVLRFYNLDQLPFGTWYDEAANGLEALRVANEPNFRPVYNAGVNAAGHYLFLIVLFFEWFGVASESIRMISAVMGVGMVLAAFGLGTSLFGYQAGLIVAALLAVSRWSVNFSRIGMYNISTPLFALAALYFLIRAVRNGRLADYGMAGLAAGLGMTFYSAYYLFAPVLLLVIGAALIQARRTRTQGEIERFSWVPMRRVAWGVAVLMAAFGVVMAPTAKFALEQPDTYFGRVRTTSLLARVAPDERLAALGRNTMQHLRMFHLRGDPNGRHNIPGWPMLDPISGGLMILGLLMCLARPRALVSLLLPVWLGSALLGGILSLDFESPQSLRSIGALPPAYLLAALPLAALLRTTVRLGGKRPTVTEWPVVGRVEPVGAWAAHRLPAVIVTVCLIVVVYLNGQAYFVDQAHDFASWNAFSTPETLAARRLATTSGLAEGETVAYIISLYDGHPTLRFLAGNAGAYRRLETTDSLPILGPPDRDILLIADAERRYFFDEAQLLYPNARFEAIQPPFGGPTVLYTVHISKADQRALHGARAAYFEGPDWNALANDPVPTLEVRTSGLGNSSDARWPADLPEDASDLSNAFVATETPYWVEWSGTLMIPSYGPHLFRIAGPGKAELYIGEELVVEYDPVIELGDERQRESDNVGPGTGHAIMLAQGPHAVQLRAAAPRPGAPARVDVYWRPPDRAWEPLPDWLVFHEPDRPRGLLGRYYANGDWSPPEAFARIDGRWEMYFHTLPLPRPYTVEWQGKLRVAQAGEYGLGLQSTDDSTLWIGTEEIAHSPGGGMAGVGRRYLAAGLHDIRIRYADRTNHTNFRLFWEPPDGSGRATIPAAFLMPPQDDYTRLELAFGADEPPWIEQNIEGDMADVRAPGGSPVLSAGPVAILAGEAQVVVAGLYEPSTVAVGVDGTLWVAEPRAGQVRGFSATGALLRTLRAALDGRLQEPYALAVNRSGHLLVLDAEAGSLHRFTADGEPLSALAVAPEWLHQSRGLLVDDQDAIWIAATARGQLVQLNANGHTMQTVAMRVGGSVWQDAQPVSVAQAASGGLLVSDPGLGRLVSYSAAGQRIMAWDIPAANTFAGPHLAAGEDGLVYRSSPEEGEIVAHYPTGEPALAWRLRTPAMPALQPVGLAMGESGIIWIIDAHGGTLLRMQLPVSTELLTE